MQSIQMWTRRPRSTAPIFKRVQRRREPEKPSPRPPLDILAWLNAAFTLALAIFAYQAWKESERAREIFQGQLTAAKDQIVAAKDAQRAWLTLEINLASKFEKLSGSDFVMIGLTGGTYRITFNYKIKNIGHVPARAVAIRFTQVLAHPVFDFPSEQLINQQHKICTRPGGLPDGSTIFPEEPPLESDYTIRIPREKWPKGPFPGKAYLYLAGCVIYRTGDDDKDHHTAFAYDVEAKDGLVFAFPSDPSTIEQGKLRVTSLPYSDLHAAD